MASSLLHPSSAISFSSSTSSSSSSSYSLVIGSSHTSTLRAQGLIHHSRTQISMKCDMQEASVFRNGKPTIPILNEQTLPKFLQSARAKKIVNRNGNRLKLFSGSTNPILSQEIAQYMGLELGKLSIKRFTDGEIYPLQENARGCNV